ncbi:hypothetical protein DOK67_0001413 [Enterococcus sp. DIV0212c]|uniref:InlB B-repeat-containing protein n=1 Tax=Enterococcus sp. DIV0212c TaxID=2230867 RepID=UPI001A9C09D1|nr:InlB B-repeat-containing protein [Enterococcus sp. DIV0212c]MBO1354379.1 InlB B-repeat-containing protein [Enterococcus sp. DIV0212c]
MNLKKHRTPVFLVVFSIAFFSLLNSDVSEAAETVNFNYYISIPYADKTNEDVAFDISSDTNKIITYAKHGRGNQTLGFEYYPKDDAYIIFSGENKQKLVTAEGTTSGSYAFLFDYKNILINSLTTIPSESLWKIEKSTTDGFFRLVNKKSNLAFSKVNDTGEPLQLKGIDQNDTKQLFKLTSLNGIMYIKPSTYLTKALDISGGVAVDKPLITYDKGTQMNQQWYSVFLASTGTFLIGNYEDRSLLLNYPGNDINLTSKRFSIDVTKPEPNIQFIFNSVSGKKNTYTITTSDISNKLTAVNPKDSIGDVQFSSKKVGDQEWTIELLGTIQAPIINNLKLSGGHTTDVNTKLPVIYPGEKLTLTGELNSSFFKQYDLYAKTNLDPSTKIQSNLSIQNSKGSFAYNLTEAQTSTFPKGINYIELNARADHIFPSNSSATSFMVDLAIPTITADKTMDRYIEDNSNSIIKGTFIDKKANNLTITAKINQSSIEIPVLKQTGTKNETAVPWTFDLNSLTSEQKSLFVFGKNEITFTLKNDWKTYNTATAVTTLNLLGRGTISYKEKDGKELQNKTILHQSSVNTLNYLADIPATITDYKLTTVSGDGTLVPNKNQITGLYSNKVLDVTANYEQYRFYLSYDGNGASNGTVPKVQQFEVGQELQVSTPDALKKEGYHFKEWNTKADGTGKSYQPKELYQTTNQNKTLYAIWKPDKVTMTVYFNQTLTDKPIYQDIRVNTNKLAPIKYLVPADADLSSTIDSMKIPLTYFGYTLTSSPYVVKVDGKIVTTTFVPEGDFSVIYSYNGTFNIKEPATVDFGNITLKNKGTTTHAPINNPVLDILNTDEVSQWTLYIKQEQPLKDSETFFKGAFFYLKENNEIELTAADQPFVSAETAAPFTSMQLGGDEKKTSGLYLKEYVGNKVGEYHSTIWWSLVKGP